MKFSLILTLFFWQELFLPKVNCVKSTFNTKIPNKTNVHKIIESPNILEKRFEMLKASQIQYNKNIYKNNYIDFPLKIKYKMKPPINSKINYLIPKLTFRESWYKFNNSFFCKIQSKYIIIQLIITVNENKLYELNKDIILDINSKILMKNKLILLTDTSLEETINKQIIEIFNLLF